MRRNTGRRAWLLNSASGAVILAGMAVMTPEQAQAACATVAGIATCNGSSGSITSNANTVIVTPSGGGSSFTLDVGNGTNPVSVSASAAFVNGVNAGVLSPIQRDVTVNVNYGASVTSNQAAGVIVRTDGAGNDAIVNVNGFVSGREGGVIASAGALGNPAGAGSVSVVVNGTVQSTNLAGVWGNRSSTTDGSLGVSVEVGSAGSVSSLNGQGVLIGTSILGSVGTGLVTNSGSISGGDNGVWTNTSGLSTVINKTGATIQGGRDGIAAYGELAGIGFNVGGGVTVDNSGEVVGGRNGVFAIATGTVTVENTGGTITGTAGDGVRIGSEQVVSSTVTLPIYSLGDATVNNDGGLIEGGRNGVTALVSGKLTISNQSSGSVASTIRGAQNGIVFGTSTGAGIPIPHLGDVQIDNAAGDSIVGDAASGISGVATGQIAISNAFEGTISGGTNGISVTSVLSGVNIVNGGTVTAGQNGIVAIAGLGNVVIDGEDDGAGGKTYGFVDATNGSGIFGAAIGNGSVSIDAGAVNAGADNAFTIPGLGIGVGGGVVGLALGDGAVDVRLHGNVSVDGGTFGAAAIALGDGDATVSLDDGVVIDPPLIGTAAISVNGNSTVTIGNNNIVDATLAGAVGLNFGSGGITVDVGNNSVIGNTDVPVFGILTLDTSGSALTAITVGTDSTVNGQTSAILAIAAGSGSTVSIANNGGAIVGGGGAAPVISVYSDSGTQIDNNNVMIGLDEHRGVIKGATGATDDLAVLTGGGPLTLNNNGDVIGRAIALTTNGGSNAFNNNAGGTWTTSGASALVTTGSGSNTLTNAYNAQVDLTDGSVNLGSIAGNNTLVNDGTFNVLGAAMFNLGSVSGSNFVQNTGGFTSQGAVMFNLGSVTGSNDFSNTGNMQFVGIHAFDFGTVEGNNSLTNGGYIGVAGLTAFNFGSVDGSNTVTNDGRFETYGLTTFNFAAGETSTFNNNEYFSTTGVTSFRGLDTFNNNGVLDLVNNQSDYHLVSMPGTESGVGDWVLINGNYVAGSNSVLAVDTRLSVKGDSSSDLLSITGSVTGATKVYVNADPTAVGGYNPDGITVVRVWTGDTGVGDFELANGPIHRGLFDYDLFLKSEAEGGGASPMADAEGGASWVLASYANASTYNLSEFTGLAQGIWNTTSDSWIDRAGDLRVSAQQSQADPTKKSGIWGRIIGNGADRSTDVTITPFADQSVKIDTGYNQTLWGFQAGIDHEFEGTVADGVLIAGVLGGYVTSKANFDNGDSVKFTGPQVGVYASWVKGGLYVDGLVKGDFLKADYNLAGVDAGTDSTTIGVRVESGYRFLTSTGMFIEPNASLAYANTKIDDINLSGTQVNFNNGDGLEGKLGARFGGTVLKDGVKYDPYLSVGIAGDLLSDHSVFLDSGPGLVVDDNAPDVFGEVGAGINIFSSKSGWTGFAKADLRFGDDYVGGTGKIGANWAW